VRQQADRHRAEHSNVTNVCAQIYRAPQVLFGVLLSASDIRENTVFASQEEVYSMEFVKSQNALFLPLFIPLFLSLFIPLDFYPLYYYFHSLPFFPNCQFQLTV
jgi:hypothetical protein